MWEMGKGTCELYRPGEEQDGQAETDKRRGRKEGGREGSHFTLTLTTTVSHSSL